MGFVWYSLLASIWNRAKQDQAVPALWDVLACRLAATLSLLYLAVFCLDLVVYYLGSIETQESVFLLGPNFALGLNLLLVFTWVFLAQGLWYPQWQKRLWYRFALGLLAWWTLERLVLITTSIHRDYLPSLWSSMGLNGFFWLAWLWKLGVFVALVWIAQRLLPQNNES